MNRSIVTAAIASTLLMACAGQHPRSESADVAPAAPKAAASPRGELVVLPARFAGNLNIDKVKQECSMLSTLNAAVLRYGNAYRMKLRKRQRPEEVRPGQSVLLIEYDEVVSHEVSALTLRPASEATVRATIQKDGEVIGTMTKTLGSRVSFGACDRLDKIATAGGKSIARWAARQPY